MREKLQYKEYNLKWTSESSLVASILNTPVNQQIILSQQSVPTAQGLGWLELMATLS